MLDIILDKYQLVELIGGDEERTSFRARDASGSRDVVVHVLKPSSPTEGVKPELATVADTLFSSGRVQGLLFAGECDSKFYIVTEARPECHDVRRWLEQNSAASPSPSSPDLSFARASVWKVPEAAQEPATKPAAAKQSPVNEPQISEPGEFTRLFVTPPLQSQPREQPGRQNTPSASDSPGEFTRIFGAPVEVSSVVSDFGSASPGSGIPKQIDSEPGEFTRMFQAAPPAQARAPEISTTPFASAPAAARDQRDIALPYLGSLSEPAWQPRDTSPSPIPFEPAAVAAAPVQSGLRQNNDEAATGIFATPSPMTPPAPQVPAGPSDFTRVIAVPSIPVPSVQVAPVPQPPVPQAAPPAPVAAEQRPATTTSSLPLILILNGLFVIAVLIVLYFALKK